MSQKYFDQTLSMRIFTIERTKIETFQALRRQTKLNAADEKITAASNYCSFLFEIYSFCDKKETKRKRNENKEMPFTALNYGTYL